MLESVDVHYYEVLCVAGVVKLEDVELGSAICYLAIADDFGAKGARTEEGDGMLGDDGDH